MADLIDMADYPRASRRRTFPGPEFAAADRIVDALLRPSPVQPGHGVAFKPATRDELLPLVASVVRDHFTELAATYAGECKDPDHAGLRRMLTSMEFTEKADRGYMGQDVEVLHLLLTRVIQENKEHWKGTIEREADRLSVIIGVSISVLLVGFVLGFIIFGGGR